MKYLFGLMLALYIFVPKADYDGRVMVINEAWVGAAIGAIVAAASAAKASHDNKKTAHRARENRLAEFKVQQEERESDLEAQKRQRDLDKEADIAARRAPQLQRIQQGEQKLASLGIESEDRGNLANRILGGGARRV